MASTLGVSDLASIRDHALIYKVQSDQKILTINLGSPHAQAHPHTCSTCPCLCMTWTHSKKEDNFGILILHTK